MYSDLGESYSPVMKITYFEGAMSIHDRVPEGASVEGDILLREKDMDIFSVVCLWSPLHHSLG